MTASAGSAVTGPHPSPAAAVVLGAVTAAVLANVAVHAAGRAFGGSFRFTSASGPAQVDAATVAGFTALPLLVGLTLAALLGRRWPRMILVAQVVAPTLAISTIFVMTLPADFDHVSTLTLASCHVVLVPVSILTLLRLQNRIG